MGCVLGRRWIFFGNVIDVCDLMFIKLPVNVKWRATIISIDRIKFTWWLSSFLLCIATFYVSPAYGKQVMTLSQIENIAQQSPAMREKENDVRAARQEIKILHAESSPILQGRIKAGHYTHFNYDGIPRAYIMKPKLGFKYYLFGGNKYLRHITAEAEPAYYKNLSKYDSESRNIRMHIQKSYVTYWENYKIARELKKILIIFKHDKHIPESVHGILERLRLTTYLSRMRTEISLHKLIETIGHKLHSFIPKRPNEKQNAHRITPSVLRRHPAIEGLIRYYHGQRKLGWLRFLDVKLKLFVRPSYYPAAGRTKMAIIGGLYLNMPIDIMGAVHHANQQLDIDRENILLKLKQDALKSQQEHKITKIKLPIYHKKERFWKNRTQYWYNFLKRVLSRDNGDIKAKNAVNKVPHALRAYREATLKWIHAEAALTLMQYRS
ncbi:hypothetical protein DLNHIDIE_02161 [Acidithiobacillus thiooxidans ATCC 19377]|jgi:hypothetical protein|uniref:Uncharacterized protein n=4 Tax=Acidithiobacillaceae TaxID=225058 RepID=A0A543Q7I0_ACITH|nr:hypothetical protein [Acidithiobacillus thiooxidans]QFX95502.1 hypothetical protein GCD22_01089 [Acidithiobacillus thiooxidans ATCC 19377]TQN52273.1 hypothetical protein DLNHIDIE_02161 [Acidithiobacillus thiooxidans ATCC 19377]